MLIFLLISLHLFVIIYLFRIKQQFYLHIRSHKVMNKSSSSNGNKTSFQSY